MYNSGLERGVGPWARQGAPTHGGHSPRQEQMDPGQTKACVTQDPSCQHLDRNQSSLSQKRPQQRTRMKGKSCQVWSLSLGGDPFFQHVLRVSLL